MVALHDLLDMLTKGEALPDGHDRELRAKLRTALSDLATTPDIKRSYQYLSLKSHDEDAWQVQVSRRRRKQHERKERSERMSREHHEGEDAEPTTGVLRDAHGNDLRPLLEAAKTVRTARSFNVVTPCLHSSLHAWRVGHQVATTKQVKRIKKATAARRRAGEDVFTDDELDAANLAPPPEGYTKAPLAKLSRPKRHTTGTTRGAVQGLQSADGVVLTDPTANEVRQWLGLMYLDPPQDASSSRGFSPSTYDTSLASGNDSMDSAGSWMLVGGGSLVARVPSGSWS